MKINNKFLIISSLIMGSLSFVSCGGSSNPAIADKEFTFTSIVADTVDNGFYSERSIVKNENDLKEQIISKLYYNGSSETTSLKFDSKIISTDAQINGKSTTLYAVNLHYMTESSYEFLTTYGQVDNNSYQFYTYAIDDIGSVKTFTIEESYFSSSSGSHSYIRKFNASAMTYDSTSKELTIKLDVTYKEDGVQYNGKFTTVWSLK